MSDGSTGGSLDHRANDVLTDICDDHVIWWPRELQWTEWIPKGMWICYDSRTNLCTCIALTKWDGPVACVLRHRKCWKFSSRKCYHVMYLQPKPPLDSISVAIWTSILEFTRCNRLICSDRMIKECGKMIILHIVAQHLRDICLQPRQSGRHYEERLERIGYPGTMIILTIIRI